MAATNSQSSTLNPPLWLKPCNSNKPLTVNLLYAQAMEVGFGRGVFEGLRRHSVDLGLDAKPLDLNHHQTNSCKPLPKLSLLDLDLRQLRFGRGEMVTMVGLREEKRRSNGGGFGGSSIGGSGAGVANHMVFIDKGGSALSLSPLSPTSCGFDL